MGGNRTGNVYINLLIVFVATGLWHGASFNFLIWGLWHGFFLIIERALKLNKIKEKGLAPLQHAITLLIIIVGWVFFRIENLREALTYIGIMFGVVQPKNSGFTAWYYIDIKVIIILVIAVIASMPLFNTELFETVRDKLFYKCISSIATLFLFILSIIFVVSSTYNPFIYFRF